MADRASRAWLCTQNKPLNDSWVTVTGGDAKFIKELITSSLLASAETPNSGTDGHARTPGFCAWKMQNSKAQFEDHTDLLSARDAASDRDGASEGGCNGEESSEVRSVASAWSTLWE